MKVDGTTFKQYLSNENNPGCSVYTQLCGNCNKPLSIRIPINHFAHWNVIRAFFVALSKKCWPCAFLPMVLDLLHMGFSWSVSGMEAEYYFVWFPFLSRELVCFSPISSFFFRFSCHKTTLNQSCWVHRMGGWVLGHQVGVIDGLMTTFLDVDSVVVEQVVPMTRFTIRTSVELADSFRESGPQNGLKTIQVKDLWIIHCLEIYLPYIGIFFKYICIL